MKTLIVAMFMLLSGASCAYAQNVIAGADVSFLRQMEGRGVVFDELVDIPQLVGLGMVLLGGAVLWDWRRGSAMAEKVHNA